MVALTAANIQDNGFPTVAKTLQDLSMINTALATTSIAEGSTFKNSEGKLHTVRSGWGTDQSDQINRLFVLVHTSESLSIHRWTLSAKLEEPTVNYQTLHISAKELTTSEPVLATSEHAKDVFALMKSATESQKPPTFTLPKHIHRAQRKTIRVFVNQDLSLLPKSIQKSCAKKNRPSTRKSSKRKRAKSQKAHQHKTPPTPPSSSGNRTILKLAVATTLALSALYLARRYFAAKPPMPPLVPPTSPVSTAQTVDLRA